MGKTYGRGPSVAPLTPQRIVATGGANYNLPWLLQTPAQIAVFVGGQIQYYGPGNSYVMAAVSGVTQLQFTENIPNGMEILIIPFSSGGSAYVPAAGSVNQASLAADTIAYMQGLGTTAANTALGNNTFPFKNKIMNGNFDIWQRGTSLAASAGTGRYLADRWASNSTGTTIAASQQTFSPGQGVVPNEPLYFSRTVVTSVANTTNYAYLAQSIESVRTLAGVTATISFWAKADSARNIALEFSQNFGSGGSPSSTIFGINVITVPLTSSWQKFTYQITIPTISGKILGTTANTDSLSVLFWFDAGSAYNARTNTLGQQSGTFDIAQVQLEAGSIATQFEMRPIGQELLLCKRYYCTSYPFGNYAGATTLANTINGTCYTTGIGEFLQFSYPVQMRIVPTVTVYSPVTGAVGAIADYNTTSDVTGVTGLLEGGDSRFSGFTGPPFTAGHLYRCHVTLNADF
ncbi:hypothetical protein [Ralstonia phage RP13]|nr:hypothetical protein [Ralstonia phage RP13]